MFFPEGKSSKGQESDFEFDVLNPLPRDVSIDTIYIHKHCFPAVVSEPAVVPPDEMSTSELTKNRSDLLQFISEHHISLPEVFLISEESITESSVTRENSTSSSYLASTLVNIRNDRITLFVDDNYAVLEDVAEVTETDTSDPEIIIGAQETSDESLSDTLIYQPDEFPLSPLHTLPEITLVLHQSNSFSEMTEAFSDPDIMNKTVKVKHLFPDNSVERGIGWYSSFWAEFYESCTLGTTLRVPFLRHDFSAHTWRAIGRILAKGFQDYPYLPFKLAPPFLEGMLHGTVHSDMRSSFLQFAAKSEMEAAVCTGSNLCPVSGHIKVEFTV